MRQRKIQVGQPAYEHAPARACRTWTELTIDAPDLMRLLGMPDGTRLISMRRYDESVMITVEQPVEESCSEA